MSSKKKCPMCEEPVEALEQNDYFPFCSKRCKQRDLGQWFNEGYSIPITPQSTERRLEASESDEESREE